MRFGLTESYLSTLIKTHLGVNYSVYLENLRIARANELLATQKLTVAEIAERVGYANAPSFRRAYKRVTGYSPSQHQGAAY